MQQVQSINQSFMVVYNALRLFYAYKHYLKTHQWILADLPHGSAANQVLDEEAHTKGRKNRR
jgi:hypothetical protein